MTFERYEDLEGHLRDWRSMSGREAYDVVGMLNLFRACLVNLRDNALEAELDDAVGVLEPTELDFLRRLVDRSPR